MMKQHPTTIQTIADYVQDPAHEKARFYLCNVDPTFAISTHRLIYAQFSTIPADDEKRAVERMTLRHNAMYALQAVMTSHVGDEETEHMILDYLEEHRLQVTDPLMITHVSRLIDSLTKFLGEAPVEAPVCLMKPIEVIDYQGAV